MRHGQEGSDILENVLRFFSPTYGSSQEKDLQGSQAAAQSRVETASLVGSAKSPIAGQVNFDWAFP